jgi:hypothetical protein
MYTLWHFCQEDLCDFCIGWVLAEVHWDKKLFGLFVNIANINTTFVGEVDPVAL